MGNNVELRNGGEFEKQMKIEWGKGVA